MAQTTAEIHRDLMNRFIDMANTMKEEEAPLNVIASALMSASAVYATYSVVGNNGALEDSGVEKMTDAYREHVKQVQVLRKQEITDKQQAQQQQQDAPGE